MIQRVLRSSVLLMSTAIMMMTAGGCASGSSSRDTTGAVPIDLSMDVAIQPAVRGVFSTDDELSGILPGAGGRFVMGPGGLLRFGPVQRPNADWIPTGSRLLGQDELADLWTLIRQLGYADPDGADQTTSRPGDGPTLPGHCRLALSGWNTRWHFDRAITATGEGASDALAYDPAMRQLVTRLARIAWLEPNRPAHTVVPRRYQFGPDPYAMYR